MKDFQSLPKSIKNLSHRIWRNLFLTPLFLSGLLVGIFIWDAGIHYRTRQEVLPANLFATYQPSQYPVLSSKAFPIISAQAAFILDADSHVVLFSKNPDVRLSPASTTKIMTAMVALDHYDTTDVLTITDKMDTQGSGLGLFGGEQLTFGDLLYGALLPSANDAAYAIAQNYPGGMPAFLQKMNEKAAALHLYDTRYGDPAGLDDDRDYTTARELAELSAYAMKDPIFARAVNTKTAMISSIDMQYTYPLENRNILLGVDGINGIKTGFTDEAGEVLATSVNKNGHQFYVVVMRSQDRFVDTSVLVHFIEQNLGYLTIRP